MRILLVEDDPMIGESIRRGLRTDGFSIDWVQDGQTAERALKSESYPLLLLDLGLPRKSGLEVLGALRQRGDSTPVLILTARDAVADRVQGLDAGADDYLVKPFDLDELAARIRALLRRQAGRSQPLLISGALTLNPVTHEVTHCGQPLILPAKEFALLQLLMERPGAVLSRAQLEERLYGWNENVASNAVEVHIHHLRKKLGAGTIQNVRGLGYMVAAS